MHKTVPGLALLAATLPQVAARCDFYGAGVATGRPGGGRPAWSWCPRFLGACGASWATRIP